MSNQNLFTIRDYLDNYGTIPAYMDLDSLKLRNQPKHPRYPTKPNVLDWQKLLEENPNIKEEVYLKICDALVMEYKSETIGIDDIQISDEPIPEG